MKIALCCAGEIGLNALETIQSAGFGPELVFSYPVEYPNHESMEKIRGYCERHDLEFLEEDNITSNYAGLFSSRGIDYLIAIKWRKMVSNTVISSLNKEMIVFHATLLPKYRGFAPINWPIINGEKETGVTMFFAAEEVDSGDIIDQVRIPITENDDAGTIDAQVNSLVSQLLETNLPLLDAGNVVVRKQDHAQATYAIWRDPLDGKIDWSDSTENIHNLIRGLAYPYPGAYTMLDQEKLLIWKARPIRTRTYVGSIPGKVERIVKNEGVNILTGDGILQIQEVQLPGKEVINASNVITRLKTRFS